MAAGSSDGFEVATFYSEGPPHDKGLPLTRQRDVLRALMAPHCRRFHSYSARRIRSLTLRDGTRGALFAREYSRAAGSLRYPNTGYNTIGFGAFKPFVILHVLERLADGEALLFMDCNVFKHWNLGALPHLAAETTRWVLARYGPAREGVVMPRENGGTRLEHICSAAALRAAEARCGVPLAHLLSPHSNRVAVQKGRDSERMMRLWLNTSLLEDEYDGGHSCVVARRSELVGL